MAYELESELELELENEFEGGPPVRTLPPVVIVIRPFRRLQGFAFDKSFLAPHHPPIIRDIAARVRRSFATGSPVVMIRLVGHADSRGPRAYNEGLGLRRAQTVRAALIRALGPLAGRVTILPQTLGERQPAARNTTPKGRELNRRVEVFLVFGGPRPGPGPGPRPSPGPGPAREDPRCLESCERDFKRCLDTTNFPPACIARRGTCQQGCIRR
jgi:outer membrane protein OmpA-like peptidoglycan-associated protein